MLAFAKIVQAWFACVVNLMDVTCDSCATVYEFEEALLSERGTSVKCMACGHTFKVFRAASSQAPENWVVRTTQGKEYQFAKLRELQAAINQGVVRRDDVLMRGAARPKRLGSIAELETFFSGSDSAPPGAFRNTNPLGLSPLPPSTAQRQERLPQGTLPGIGVGVRSSIPPKPVSAAEVQTPREPSRETSRTTVSENMAEREHSDNSSPSMLPTELPGNRGSRSVRFLAMLAGGLGILLIGVQIGRRAVENQPPTVSTVPSATTFDPAKLSTSIQETRQRLSAGDLIGAQAKLKDARAIAKSDPEVVMLAIDVASEQADASWLLVRLLADDAPERAAALSEFEGNLSSLNGLVSTPNATDKAAAKHPVVLRARVNSYRMASDFTRARSLASELAPTQSENVIALAALDIAEGKDLSQPIERLRELVKSKGAAAEARARELLVYALVRSGERQAAKNWLDEFAQTHPRHPMLSTLQTFVARSETSASLDVQKLPNAEGSDADPSDVRDALRLGNEARAKGELKRAELLLEAAERLEPKNSEVLEALADIARTRGNSSQAERYYRRILESNPGYLPALNGLADLNWQRGDRDTAVAYYRQVLERGESTSYARRAKDRIAEVSGASQPKGDTPSVPSSAPSSVPSSSAVPAPTTSAPDGQPKSPAPEPSPPASSTLPPGVDTSDLPNFKP